MQHPPHPWFVFVTDERCSLASFFLIFNIIISKHTRIISFSGWNEICESNANKNRACVRCSYIAFGNALGKKEAQTQTIKRARWNAKAKTNHRHKVDWAVHENAMRKKWFQKNFQRLPGKLCQTPYSMQCVCAVVLTQNASSIELEFVYSKYKTKKQEWKWM